MLRTRAGYKGRTVSMIRRTRGGLARFCNDESGATSIEYGLICSLIFLAIVAGVKQLNNNTMVMYNKIVANT